MQAACYADGHRGVGIGNQRLRSGQRYPSCWRHIVHAQVSGEVISESLCDAIFDISRVACGDSVLGL